MTKANILVVDDDARLRGLLSEYLVDQGFFVCEAEDAATAREKLKWLAFDAMVLDRMMPGETGLELAGDLAQSAPPILMLTAMGEASERIEGLEAGVQDYLTKPFEPRELVLRLRNLLTKNQQTHDVHFGPFHYAMTRQQLLRGDVPVYLTASEQQLLALLASHQGQAVSREHLASELGLEDAASRSIDVQVGRLRKKIEADPSRPAYLQTVRGEGYRLT